jgi:hypothetical protein
MASTFRTIRERPIVWVDPKGRTHSCESADVQPGIRLLWTDCQRDVPQSEARLMEPGDIVNCPRCAPVSYPDLEPPMPDDLDPLPTDASWPDRIEYEVNRQLGGDASVGEIVEIMIEMGWQPPAAS